MALHTEGRFNVVEDFDGLHIVPTYRVMSGGAVIMCTAKLMACGVFVATYVSQLVAGKDTESAKATAFSAMQPDTQAAS
jgi:hypothetical protein